MKIFLLLIPLITVAIGLLIYKFQNKKKEFLKLDLVQFVYLFLIAPTMFVWMKSFIFYILRNELQLNLSVTELFIIDTVFSVLSFVVISAIAIHSLTKTFWIKRHHDPEFDIYHLSEYFHLWWTHIVVWGGVMILGTFLSVVNVLVPLEFVVASKLQFYSLFGLGFISGIMFFFVIWNSDPQQGNYMRLMKLFLAFSLLIHIIIYFIFEPSFNISNGVYWFMLSALAASVFAASTFERYEKTNRFREFLLHSGWGENKGVNLFSALKIPDGIVFMKNVKKKK
ncbi:MAG: hypothetical protein COZ34_00805 [Candidatus Pacebacteria bacterium CG_4_10_14_3_um_filter_34_15]|nr:hypothetical protein [Candidatus Pacearchaeota archaeon]NCQ65700.1 hypothetical protein [Candidatus Paceibacterota bacterium]OIO44676.1 MAG: hypothetical protein AUJ41_02345 [Candidatus Pacebacteria bacterium CG1_02_43_31]PIQ81340.1 MAG: hypothetical protein COV78_00830 [Candidatus Pacebacteria bacterium CG11_big_fil_rev_8_21_14_0_20_34_55]PIX81926.1 MAG: hypothetical protein COZ34_00805 [Candidatus Pacebacteria bacterium CG_4_10_14_3_um_filter_34_15]PJC43497.1 MAG: hypothetical protein CO0